MSGLRAVPYAGDIPSSQQPCAVDECARQVGPKGARGFCPRHYQRWQKTGSPTGTCRPSAEDRFFAKIREAGECWEWTAAVDGNGYGLFSWSEGRSSAGGGHLIRSHIWSYQLLIGDIPDGLELDHLCRNRRCCNPWHLDPVTHAVNVQRSLVCAPRTHCPQQHEYTPDNTYVNPRGRRICITCSAASRARYQERKRRAA